MAGADLKLADLEKGGSEQETAFSAEADESSRFIPASSSGDGKLRNSNGEVVRENSEQSGDEFYGLTREELENYASDPKWVKIRWILFAIFVICWAAMLIAAIVIVVLTPKCPAIPELSWFQTDVTYKVDVENFQDSDGDAVGDITGLQSRLSYFTDMNIKSIWLTKNIIDPADPKKVAPKYGNLEDLEKMTKDFRKKGIRLMMDFGDVTGLDNSTSEALVRSWADAGVDGFVVDQANGASNQTGNAAAVITRWQQILDDEYNKRDDRDRAVIGGPTLADSPSIKLTAVVYKPSVSENCTNNVLSESECNKMKISASESDPEQPWRIAEVNSWNSALVDLVMKLAQAGTPNVIYGDEIGLTGSVDSRPYMLWDETDQGGFTDKEGFASNAGVDSVMAQGSIGYNKVSYINLFKELSAARNSEQSLRWGNVTATESEEAVVFYREAKDFPPVVVAVNGGKTGYASNLVRGDFTQGEILVSNVPDLVVGESFDMSAIYLKPEGVVVARLSKPVEE